MKVCDVTISVYYCNYTIHTDNISKALFDDAAVLQFEKTCKLHIKFASDYNHFLVLDYQWLEEQLRSVANILKLELETERKQRFWFEEKCEQLEPELDITTQKFEAEKEERLRLEEKCEKLELELKKITNEKSNEIQILQEKLGMHSRLFYC